MRVNKTCTRILLALKPLNSTIDTGEFVGATSITNKTTTKRNKSEN